MKETKILFLTDIHQNYEILKKIDFSEYKIILCGGDFIDPSSKNLEIINRIIDILPSNIYFVPGNCDKDQELLEKLNKKFINLDKNFFYFENFLIIGIGYCRSLIDDLQIYRNYFLEDKIRVFNFYNNSNLKFLLEFCGIKVISNNEIDIIDFNESINKNIDFINKFCFFNENEIKSFLDNIKIEKNLNVILLTHSPPYGFFDKLNGLPNIGSHNIRNFLEKVSPELVLCGHFHELNGFIKYKKTIIHNPGALKDNKFSEIIFSENQIYINIKKY